MKIIPLSEGAFTVDRTKRFVPFDPVIDNLQERPIGSLLVEIQPFVIVTSKDVLLLDTGLGFNDAGYHQMQLTGNLIRKGIDPDKVTKVLLSHLHKDHAGGLGLPEDKSSLSLPNAIYYVQKREFDLAISGQSPSYIAQDVEALKSSGRVVFLTEDEGMIGGYIQYQLTGAHSPFHQVFWVREDNQTILFGGDVAPQLQQMRIRYKTKYDYEPEKALQLRREWWEQGIKEGWTFLFYHDIKTPVWPLQS